MRDEPEEYARKLKMWQERGAPVQPDRVYGSDRGKRPAHAFPLRIPWHFQERAWSVYAAAGHGDQSAVRLAERGGFSVLEIVACLALGNYHADYKAITEEHVAKVRSEIEEWTSGNHALKARVKALEELLAAANSVVDQDIDEAVRHALDTEERKS